MRKSVLSVSVAAALAVPGLAAAQQAAAPAVPTLDKILEASGISVTGYIDAAYTHANRDIENGFAKVQRRLAGEPLTDYITPVGGGYFYVPPGSRGPNDWVGSGLFT